MLRETNKNFSEIISALPSSAYVLDIGGASAPLKRGDVMIDLVPFNLIQMDKAKGPGTLKITEKSYIQHDICSREPWPFADKTFDFSYCSHVLEDIRDPLWVCSEIIRVSKAGYIEIPSRLYETTFNIEVKGLSGATHHRWVIDTIEKDGKRTLRFTFKYMHIHSRILNTSTRKYSKTDDEVLRLEWKDSFLFFENWLNSGKEIFEYYLNRPISENEKWKIYRKISPNNIVSRWLRYLKKTTDFGAKLAHRFYK
jgi:hypothetical protein